MGLFGPSRREIAEKTAAVDEALAAQRAAAKAAKADDARSDRLSREHDAPGVWTNPEQQRQPKSHAEFWDAKNALMQKPDGDDTAYCTSCRGEGCDDCRGWGWVSLPGWCLLPATGRDCADCTQRKGCKR